MLSTISVACVTPEETAAACAAAVSGLASHFMLDPATYAAGAAAGFAGLDFYSAGRGGALGDVDADVVAAAFAFFEPATVRANWEQGAAVMPARDAAGRFIAAGYAWAVEHLADSVDWARLAELTGRVNTAASPACAPLFAAWRAMPEPGEGADARTLALHRMQVARELRCARHAAAVTAAAISPVEAMAVRSPHMAPLFGWNDPLPEVTDEVRSRWEGAEMATNRSLAPAYATLDGGERSELVTLCAEAVAAVT
jgi:hypothetical protein